MKRCPLAAETGIATRGPRILKTTSGVVDFKAWSTQSGSTGDASPPATGLPMSSRTTEDITPLVFSSERYFSTAARPRANTCLRPIARVSARPYPSEHVGRHISLCWVTSVEITSTMATRAMANQNHKNIFRKRERISVYSSKVEEPLVVKIYPTSRIT